MRSKPAIVPALSALGGMAALAVAPVPAAEYNWVAISLDMTKLSQNAGYGIGGGDTEAEAERYARKFCTEDGAKGCVVVTTYRQGGAVAVRAAGTGGGWDTGATKQETLGKAMASCGQSGREVVVIDCN